MWDENWLDTINLDAFTPISSTSLFSWLDIGVQKTIDHLIRLETSLAISNEFTDETIDSKLLLWRDLLSEITQIRESLLSNTKITNKQLLDELITYRTRVLELCT